MTGLSLLLAATLSIGVLMTAFALPTTRSVRLAERVEPYLGLVSRPSRLLSSPREGRALATTGRILQPFVSRTANRLDGLLGGSSGVRRRLDALGGQHSIEQFRLEQLLWGIACIAGAALLVVVRGSDGRLPSLLPSLILVGLAGLAGVLVRDRMLSVAVAARVTRMRSEFPTVVELLALSVGAGEGLIAALERVSKVGRGAFVEEFGRALSDVRSGVPLAEALQKLATRVDVVEVRRFVDALLTAVDRGTPLAEVLQAQAVDARETSRRQLIEAGGRKEIAMMVPVVFLVLPLSVIFALFPGFYGISLGST